MLGVTRVRLDFSLCIFQILELSDFTFTLLPTVQFFLSILTTCFHRFLEANLDPVFIQVGRLLHVNTNDLVSAPPLIKGEIGN